MSVLKFNPSLLTALVICGCSQAQSPAASSALTVRIPANQDVATKILLPPDTYKVRMQTGPAAFTCKNLQLVSQKGRNPTDNYFDPVDPIQLPANLDSTQSLNSRGDPYVLVYIRCHGGSTDSKLMFTPSP